MQTEMMEMSREAQRTAMAQMRGARGGRGASTATSILGSLGGMIPGVGMFVGQAAQMAASAAAQAEQARREQAMDGLTAMAERSMEAGYRIQELEMAFSRRCERPGMAPMPMMSAQPETEPAEADGVELVNGDDPEPS